MEDRTAIRLRHFFEGMLKREEVASAFLATLLDYQRDFRQAFLRLVLPDRGPEREDWCVFVEEGRIDVTLRSPSTVVLIENKINSGAKQDKQLLRYYRDTVARNPDKRIVAVYLAPGSVGVDEVARVLQSADFAARPQDRACHLSWEALREAAAALDKHEHAWFRDSGLDEILRAIEEARRAKYPRVGDRDVVRQIGDLALERLAPRFPHIHLSRWSGRDREEILTNGTTITMWLHAVFETDDAPPHAPLGVTQEDGIHLTIQTQVKLAGKVPKSSELAARWRVLVKAKEFEVPGLATHVLQLNGWFAHAFEVVGSADEVADRMASAGERVLEALGPYFALPSTGQANVARK